VVGAAGLIGQSSSADDPKQPAPKAEQKAKDIDVVICLDVSGSMGGLIDSAKNKLWDIVNELAKVKPAPNLRVGLYSYGHTTYDPKKGWVRKEIDLTTDLDQLYQKLFGLTINGGEEYVTRVCRDAVLEQKWSTQKDSLKLIFVCGNEPANQDPVVSMKAAADLAKKHDIIINPILCDENDPTWDEYAKLTGGRLAKINHNLRVVIKTPMDKELADIGVKLNDTYVAYGKEQWKAQNQKDQTKNALTQGYDVVAGRVTSQNTALYRCEGWDLVDKCKSDPKFDITKVK